MAYMAKRGQRLLWRVEYEWSTGTRGRAAFGSRDEAEATAQTIRDAGERWDDRDVTVRVYNRETGQ